MAGNNNSGGDGVESGVYSCNWTLGGGEQGGHEFPVLSAGRQFCSFYQELNKFGKPNPEA